MEVEVLKYPAVRNYIAGQFVEDAPRRAMEVFSPLSGAVISTVPLSEAAAKDAFPNWSATPIKERVQVFYRYKALLEKHLPELTALVREENGKTTDEVSDGFLLLARHSEAGGISRAMVIQ